MAYILQLHRFNAELGINLQIAKILAVRIKIFLTSKYKGYISRSLP